MTPAQLRRAIEAALHKATGAMETWPLVHVAMDRHLGPAIGVSALERWERMGVRQLELLLEAIEERAAIQAEGRESA